MMIAMLAKNKAAANATNSFTKCSFTTHNSYAQFRTILGLGYAADIKNDADIFNSDVVNGKRKRMFSTTTTTNNNNNTNSNNQEVMKEAIDNNEEWEHALERSAFAPSVPRRNSIERRSSIDRASSRRRASIDLQRATGIAPRGRLVAPMDVDTTAEVAAAVGGYIRRRVQRFSDNSFRRGGRNDDFEGDFERTAVSLSEIPGVLAKHVAELLDFHEVMLCC